MHMIAHRPSCGAGGMVVADTSLPLLMVLQDCVHVATSLLPSSVFESADQVRLALVWAALAEVGTHAISPIIFVEQHRAPAGVAGQLRFTIKNFDFIMCAEGEWVNVL